MNRLFIVLIVCYAVCAEEPTRESKGSDSQKQFRYIEAEEEEAPHRRYNIDGGANRQVYGGPPLDPAPNGPVDPPNEPLPPFRPLVTVNTGKSDFGGKQTGVGVNVGPFFQMDLNNKKEPLGFGERALNLGLNVLNGLVRVNIQRDGNRFTGKRGPILVEVGGHTVYSNGYKK